MGMGMKKRLAWGGVLGLLLAFFLGLWFFGCGGGSGPFLAMEDFPPAEEFSSGDILLLAGASWRGRTVERLSHAPFGHVGLVETDKDGVWFLHASPKTDCTVREPLAVYLASNRISCAKLLHVTADETRASAAVESAVDAANRAVPFDHRFEAGPETGLYCSELVLDAWSSVGVDLLPERRSTGIVYPVEFESSPVCRERFFVPAPHTPTPRAPAP